MPTDEPSCSRVLVTQVFAGGNGTRVHDKVDAALPVNEWLLVSTWLRFDSSSYAVFVNGRAVLTGGLVNATDGSGVSGLFTMDARSDFRVCGQSMQCVIPVSRCVVSCWVCALCACSRLGGRWVLHRSGTQALGFAGDIAFFTVKAGVQRYRQVAQEEAVLRDLYSLANYKTCAAHSTTKAQLCANGKARVVLRGDDLVPTANDNLQLWEPVCGCGVERPFAPTTYASFPAVRNNGTGPNGHGYADCMVDDQDVIRSMASTVDTLDPFYFPTSNTGLMAVMVLRMNAELKTTLATRVFDVSSPRSVLCLAQCNAPAASDR